MFGPRVHDFLALRKPKMGTWPVRARSGSKSTLLKRNFSRKSQAKIFRNSGRAVRFGRPARLGGTVYVTFPLWARRCCRRWAALGPPLAQDGQARSSRLQFAIRPLIGLLSERAVNAKGRALLDRWLARPFKTKST